jgi:hypothetical protein
MQRGMWPNMPILGVVASSTRQGRGGVASYESIATANGTGSSGTITFSSIPSTYKHLQLRIYAIGTAGAGGYPTQLSYFRLNSDSGGNYRTLTTYANATTQVLGNGSNTNNADFLYLPGASSGIPSPAIIDIFDYSDTNKLTSLRNISGGWNSSSTGGVFATGMLWNSTATVNTITLVGDPTYNGNWTTNSKFALYGIKG